MSSYDERGRGSRWRDEETGQWTKGPPIEEELPPERGDTPQEYVKFLEATVEPEYEIEVEIRDIYKD